MSIFKRIEVWILLVVTVAGLVFVLLSDDDQDAFDLGDPAPVATKTNRQKPTTKVEEKHTGPLEIGNVTIKREADSYLAEIDFKFENPSDQSIHTIESAKLVTAGGKATPVFFLAFTGTPPVLDPQVKTEATLRFQLLGEDIVGAIELDIAGHRSPVKSARSFDPEAIAANSSKSFTQLDW